MVLLCQNITERKLSKTCSELTEADKERIRKEVKKRMDDEAEIIEKLKNLISETDEISTDITSHQQTEIKDKVINDVNQYLFEYTKTCPLCSSPCNEIHIGGAGPYSQHKSRCHRPLGFATYRKVESKKFVTLSCNDSIKSDGNFKTGTQTVNIFITETIERLMIITTHGILKVLQVTIIFTGNTLHIKLQRI